MKILKLILSASLLLAGSLLHAQNEYTAKKVQIGQSQKEYQLSKVGHYFVLNGDIIMGDDLPKTRSYIRTDVTGMPLNLWPQGYVPVMISPDVVKWDMYPMVLKALTTLNTQTNVRFKPRKNEADYIKIDMFLDDPNTGGISSVGRIGGEQVLVLNRNQPEYVVLHELLHALGMWHEQSRSDRDNYVQIDLSKVKDGYKHNFQIEPGMAAGTYDYSSIMHYPGDAFAVGKDIRTILCKSGSTTSNCKLGSEALSAKDIQGLNALFTGNQSLARIDLAAAFNVKTPDIVTSGTLENGVYRIKVRNTAKYLDIKDVSKENGAVLQQWDAFTEKNQQFAVVSVGPRIYELKAMHSGRYLSVDRASTANLAGIIQWDHANQTNQQFYILYDQNRGGYAIQGVQSRKYWGLLGLLNGGLIIQQEAYVQTFSFERVGNIPLEVMPKDDEKMKTVLPRPKNTMIRKVQ